MVGFAPWQGFVSNIEVLLYTIILDIGRFPFFFCNELKISIHSIYFVIHIIFYKEQDDYSMINYHSLRMR